LGQQPTFYLSLLERLLCDVKQPLRQIPGDRLRTANSRPSSEKMDKQFYKLSEWREPEKQTLVIDLK